MDCKWCGTRNDPDSIFCKQCSRKLLPKRGFASMDKTRQRMIASAAGKKAHELGRAHQFSTDEASRAGKIGGKRSSRKRVTLPDAS